MHIIICLFCLSNKKKKKRNKERRKLLQNENLEMSESQKKFVFKLLKNVLTTFIFNDNVNMII